MQNQIKRIEDFESVNVFKGFIEANIALFTSLPTAIAITIPLFLLILSFIIISFGYFLLTETDNVVFLLLYTLISLVLFSYSFWQSLLSFGAITYLIKDTLEGKKIQKAKTYFGYVKQHTKSYIKYWLWNSLLQTLCLLIILFVRFIDTITQDSITLGILGSSFNVFLYIITGLLFFASIISLHYWAYNEKEKALPSILKAIKQTFKDPLPIVVFFALVALVLFAPLYLTFTSYYTDNILIIFLLDLMRFFMLMLTSFYLYATFTRYYFAYIKK